MWLAIWLVFVPLAAMAEPVALIPSNSALRDSRAGGLELRLGLSRPLPWRVFTMADPARLVVDLHAVEWGDVQPETLITSDRDMTLRFGTYLPGRSRLVLMLPEPMAIDAAQMQTGARVDLIIQLAPQGAAEFAATAGAPHDPAWDLPPPTAIAPRRERGPDAPLRIVLDPGHGGIDPGAQAPTPDGVGVINEKAIALGFAHELRALLEQAGGFEVILTRSGDYFVSLDRRVATAQRADADLFVSLHADALSSGLAHGASVHLLSEEASDAASEQLAQRHNRSDLLAGDAPVATEDDVARTILDLARRETAPRSAALGTALIDSFHEVGLETITRPLRQANFTVLKSADIPSVLVEIGFMSSPRDLERLTDPAWRADMARAIHAALVSWRAQDVANRALVRR